MAKRVDPERRRQADLAFDEFWAMYPRKAAKLDAKKRWDVLRPTPELVEQIKRALAWQVPTWQARNEPEYIPYPATWLNKGRWMDEPPAKARSNGTRDLIEEWGYCFHTPRCTDSDVCREKRKAEKGTP